MNTRRFRSTVIVWFLVSLASRKFLLIREKNYPSVAAGFLVSHSIRRAPWVVASNRAARRISNLDMVNVMEPISSSPLLGSLRRVLEIDSLEDEAEPRRDSCFVVGHRGALYEYVENTRESFLQCAAWGCDAVEMDIFYLPKDDSLVVFHGSDPPSPPFSGHPEPDHPARVEGGLQDYCLAPLPAQSILELTLSQVQELSLNPNFAEFGCDAEKIKSTRIPTLESVLQDMRAYELELKLELKGPKTVEPVLRCVEQMNMVGRCSYSSFDLSQLAQLRQLRPDRDRYPTGALFAGDPTLPEDFIQQALDCGATQVHLRYDQCTRSRVQQIHAAGLTSMAWLRGPRGMRRDITEKYGDVGNEDERCYQALLDTGVQQICGNRPDVLLRMLGKFDEEQ